MTSPSLPNHPFTTRPEHERVVMRQKWRDLLFLHWRVPVSVLRPLVPATLDLDLFDGEAYVGLVPFSMRDIRPTPFPAFPPLSNFHEINVRTYVRFKGEHPGVWFFSLDAANAIAVWIARTWFKLPYFFAEMSLAREGEIIHYSSRRLRGTPMPATSEIVYCPFGTPKIAEPDSLEKFLAERYLLYSEANENLFRGQVHHTPYPLQPAELISLKDSLVCVAGIMLPSSEPPLIHYATGVDVEIFPLKQI